jgi:hypothetical protein
MSNRVTLNGVAQKQGEYRGLKSKILFDAPQKAADYKSRIEDLPVDTESLINRDTEIKNLKKNLKTRGGFDGNMWQAPRAGRVKSTGEVYIFDGDHSKHLYRYAYPEAKTMPVQVIDVDSKEDIHQLFVQTNKSCKTSITAEQTFVHSVHAGEESVKKYEDVLSQSGMHVYCSHEEGGKIGDPTGPEVRFAHLKSAVLAAADPQMITEAKDLIMSCNNPLKKGKSVIPGALLRSICLLYTAYPKLRPGQECGDEFEEFFIGAVGNKLPERYGTNVERDCRSGFPKTYRMAAGIAQEIVDHQKDHPGTFKAVSKGAYNRIQKADLKRLAKARTKTQKRGKK